jgi:hypothetical protein
MSYLAMSAAPIDSDNTQSYSNENSINKKRQTHTPHAKTQKYRQSSTDFDPQKVNSVLKSIHSSLPDDDNDLGNYNPKGSSVSAQHSDNFKPINPFEFPSKPLSIGGERTKKQEGMTNFDEGLVPKPADDEDLKLQELQSNFMNDSQVREYYRKLVPNYAHSNFNKSENNKNYYSSDSNSAPPFSNASSTESNQVLIEKLNYMINLLEEQQDQKTASVTEEVVLYSFLGVFIIFVVDSFARVGKYVR